MLLTNDEILTAFPWSAPRHVSTSRGDRLLRTCPSTSDLLGFYNDNRATLASRGIVHGLKRGTTQVWEFCWWGQIPVEDVKKRDDSLALSMAVDHSEDVPTPPGMALRGYQKAGVHFALARHGTLIGDEMGLGKTAQVIGMLNLREKWRDILIICPNRVRLNWIREIDRFMLHDRSVGLVEDGLFPRSEIVVIHYEILSKFEAQFSKRLWDLVVIDECHRLKDPKTKRAQAVFGARPTAEEKRDGKLRTSGIPCRNRVALSGTPIPNRPKEIFPIINWLDPVNWGNQWKFLNDYCFDQRVGFNGGKNLPELQKKLRETVMIRRFKRDVATEIPPKVRHLVMLPATTDEARKALRSEREACGGDLTRLDTILKPDAFEGSAAAKVQASLRIPFERMSQIRHDTAVAKVPIALDFIIDLLEDCPKLVVFAHHRDVLNMLYVGLRRFGAVLVMGGTDIVTTEGLKTRFMNDPETRVFIGSLLATGTGLDGLQTACSTSVFVEDDWVPGNIDQAEDRLCRIGQSETVNSYHLVLEGSIDGRVISFIINKGLIISAALDTFDPVKQAAPAVDVPQPGPSLFGKRVNRELLGTSQSQNGLPFR